MTIIAQRPEGEKWKYTITRFFFFFFLSQGSYTICNMMYMTCNIIHTLYEISLKVDYGKFDTLNPQITSKITKNHLIGQQRK